jgi:DNA-damage-inducible protein D
MTNVRLPFEDIRQVDEQGKEFWYARQLARVLEYNDFRNFLSAIEKAKKSCEMSGNAVSDHLVEANEVVELGSGAQKSYSSFKLSRYACYLVVQNADPSKEIVALGQTYFALQTRLQEINRMAQYNNLTSEEERRLFLRKDLKDHNVQLADAAKDAGVIEHKDYGVFQNHGYKGLYGGLGAEDIKKRKGLRKNEQILDHMGSAELAANLFRATQTEEKLRREQIKGKAKANQTHYEVGAKVRKTIAELGGTMPEHLPTVESIKKIAQKRAGENNNIETQTSKAQKKKNIKK